MYFTYKDPPGGHGISPAQFRAFNRETLTGLGVQGPGWHVSHTEPVGLSGTQTRLQADVSLKYQHSIKESLGEKTSEPPPRCLPGLLSSFLQILAESVQGAALRRVVPACPGCLTRVLFPSHHVTNMPRLVTFLVPLSELHDVQSS